MIDKIICPICGKPLSSMDNSLCCEHRHNFDISSRGYVNLLTRHFGSGDNKLMSKARHDFLQRGYYANLADAVSENIGKLFCEKTFFIDAGCSDGYYTEKIYKKLPNGSECAGFDISKYALYYSKCRDKRIFFAAASVFEMPVEDEAADVIFSCFTPIAKDENQRVIKHGGYLVIVSPGKKHLYGLKEFLYEAPYENEPFDENMEGFELCQKIQVNNRITIDNNDMIMALFSMTPYYYKTPREAVERLKTLETLNTETEFLIHIYKK